MTSRVKRSLGATQARSAAMDLSLSKLGRKLLAQASSLEEGLTVHVRCRLRDRRGREIEVTAPTVLTLQQ